MSTAKSVLLILGIVALLIVLGVNGREVGAWIHDFGSGVKNG